MFCHARHGVGAKLLALKSKDVRLHHLCRELSVFTERSAYTGPSRFSSKVSHWMKCDAQSDGEIFLACDVTERAHQLFVADGSKTKLFRPLSECVGSHREDIVAEVVSRISCYRYRNP